MKNRKGETVLWLKGKDSDGPSFALVLYRPELADDAKMRRDLETVFTKIKEAARRLGLPLFDAGELEAQLKVFLGDDPQAAVGREFPVRLTDLVSGRRGWLTVGARLPEAA